MIDPESPRRHSPKTRVNLNDKLNRSLLWYAAAAGAAIGLQGTMPAEAEVVYTPANTPIQVNVPLPLDLNNDGVFDFVINNTYQALPIPRTCTVCSFFEHARLTVSPSNSQNAIWGVTSTVSVPFNKLKAKKEATNKQVQIAVPAFWGIVNGPGPGRKFEQQQLIMASTDATQLFSNFYSTRYYGQFGKNHKFVGPYLGLKFTVGGQVHYGWARIEVNREPLKIRATLTGYAYETIPNRPIITGVKTGTLDDNAEIESSTVQPPEPASLGRLAQGASGVPAWRVAASALGGAAGR
jgi:hypothetical protein